MSIVASTLIHVACYPFMSSLRARVVLFGSWVVQTGAQEVVKRTVTNLKLADIISANLFAFLAGSHLQMILHELGHALASRIVFKNPQPRVKIEPFVAGNTKYNTTELTWVGKRLGRIRALALSVIAGPGAAWFMSSMAMLIGRVTEGRCPKLAAYLIAYGRSDLFAHAFYAFNAHFSSSARRSHDFFLLSKVGLPPSVFGVILVATPLLIEFGGKKRLPF